MKNLIIYLLFAFISLSSISQELNVIPKPLKVEMGDGYFTIQNNTKISYSDKKLIYIADWLNDFLNKHYDLFLTQKKITRNKINVIHFSLDHSLGKESYTLEINQNSIIIRGDEAGLFYGLQTLLQMMPLESKGEIILSQIKIDDKPRFRYRGAMLDVGRYFFTPNEVKRFIDLMSYYKLNVLHWHLTEDAGWRVEIKKYPLLTKIGAWRRTTQFERTPEVKFDRLPHGGFYTQEQVKDIVLYAQKRNVTVIPEIDMPGHILAALAAYPELSCTGGPFKVLEKWGIQKDVLCVGNEHTYEFIENVLDEIMDMFPSEIIHVGGDEAPRDRWQECLKCQERVLNEGLKDTDELQHYFINRVGAYLQSRGRKMLGWDDEKMEGRLPDNAMVMNWRNEDRAIETANMKHEVVMAPHLYMYLDYSQGIPENEPMNIGGNLPLEMVYSYEPISPEIASENQQYIIGLQGNLWMEFIHSIYKMEYMVFPRLLAVAETGWSDSTKDFENFVLRLSHNLTWLDKEGVNFRIPDVIYRKDTIIDQEKFEVHLTPPVLGADIYYTLNGDDPMQYGLQYKSPVNVLFGDQDSIALRYIVRTRTGRVSGTRELMIKRN